MTPAGRDIIAALESALELVRHADKIGPTPVGLHQLKEAHKLLTKAGSALRRHVTVTAMRTPTRGKIWPQLEADPGVTAMWRALSAPLLHASVLSKLSIRTLQQLQKLSFESIYRTKGAGPNVAYTARRLLETHGLSFEGTSVEPIDIGAILNRQQQAKKS